MIPGYEIRIATGSDRSAIACFIDTHWKKGHALATSPKLLDWQHYSSSTDSLNFVVGMHRERGEVDGVLGFIPVSQFDEQLSTLRDYWLALWKVRDDIEARGLGISLFFYFQAAKQPRTVAGAAISSVALPIYRALRFKMDNVNQYYLINPDISEPKLIQGALRASPVAPGTKRLLKITSAESLSSYASGINPFRSSCLPTKSAAYYVNRYLRHPIYEYELFVIMEGERVQGLLVTRLVAHQGAFALRIVDFAGEDCAFSGMNGALLDLVRSRGAEFIDFYCFGIDEDAIFSSGLKRRTPNDSVIVPNYFEPFVQKNIELDFGVKHPEGARYRFVKGDSDQDRPTLVANAP